MGTRWLRGSDQRTIRLVVHCENSDCSMKAVAGVKMPERSAEETKMRLFSFWSLPTQCRQIHLPNSNSLSSSAPFQSTHCLPNTTHNSLAGVHSPPRSAPPLFHHSTPAKRMIEFYLHQLHLPPLLTFCSCCFLNGTHSFLIQFVCLNPALIIQILNPHHAKDISNTT